MEFRKCFCLRFTSLAVGWDAGAGRAGAGKVKALQSRVPAQGHGTQAHAAARTCLLAHAPSIRAGATNTSRLSLAFMTRTTARGDAEKVASERANGPVRRYTFATTCSADIKLAHARADNARGRAATARFVGGLFQRGRAVL